jgi:protein-S-isoprenylcysteine O-methyltransferase Ste14
MKGRKIILLAAACGAVVGALVARQGGRGLLNNLPAFAADKALLTHSRLYWTAVVGWVMFSVYWEVAAKGAAATKSSESRASRSIHVFLTNAALIMVLAPIRGLGRLLPVSALIMSAGLSVEALGLFLAIWARRHLGRNWSGEITIKEQHELVRSGPYRWLRHPIYTGILAMYVGGMLVTGEWLAIAGLAVIAFAYWRKIRLEEANLQTAFGAEYEAYRLQSWALVPGLF